MPQKLIVANWKANMAQAGIPAWWDEFAGASLPQLDAHVVICPPLVSVLPLNQLVAQAHLPFRVTVGVQNLSQFPGGAYTGEVTARMLAGVASHAILGHSERRRWFGETDQQVAAKVREALEQGITPIVAVDRHNWRQQLTQLDDDALGRIVVMYEPPEAISVPTGPVGTGEAAPLEDVEEMSGKIRGVAPAAPVVYGGSVKSHNAGEFLSQPFLAGVVVGSASLNADEFVNIIRQI